ncbi:MAG: phosphoribosylformylglycinamidine synthase subunit PurQ, partial [Deltaproteobacteria bacterium]|nr:phosphoribosylformylglycinamidine synthase subunit PurQ [Deltaproteobacteria bacterium]
PKAKEALHHFFQREDTLSIGICNGCQLFIELGLMTPSHENKPKMLHNASGKFECTFTSVQITENNTPMFASFAGQTLGIWSAHGEGNFQFPYNKDHYNIIGTFGYDDFPANPNGSQFATAIMATDDGRHVVSMPHMERSIFPYNWAHYPKDRTDEVSPWIQAFVNAYQWLESLNERKKT